VEKHPFLFVINVATALSLCHVNLATPLSLCHFNVATPFSLCHVNLATALKLNFTTDSVSMVRPSSLAKKKKGQKLESGNKRYATLPICSFPYFAK
jgi:hypothetical protein